MRYTAVSVAVGLVAGTSGPAAAGTSQSTITAPGGFMQAGAYSITTGGITPGQDLAASVGAPQDYHEQLFSAVSSAQASAAFSSADINNSATGTAGMGYARFSVSNWSLDTSWFALGIANGGWKESFMVSHPALTGQPGYLVFQVRARGTMHTTALTGSTLLDVTAYKDNVQLQTNPYFAPGTSDPVSTESQWVRWGLASYGVDDSRVVDGVVTMSVPITFGQSFTLGVYAAARAGQRSSGGFGGTYSSGTLDFSGQGLTWNGITAVLTAAGAPVTGYAVTSGTGLDWSTPYIACDVDLTGDAIVDFGDYLEFLNLFDAQDPRVDFNHDGIVDFSDYLEFLNLFDAGC